ncbi:hypothetical protein PROFUN_05279 [Planoprotostelium fungivorum]|uniref:Uncharacterized protein n=1 Tax=Planoprotostelium fungivorum TaxID=1890364 RepID=A0A2P6NRC0_9EUKA|nr:hypothetical protein PROFUN_05279 [Planoprotostelium fungivorum]
MASQMLPSALVIAGLLGVSYLGTKGLDKIERVPKRRGLEGPAKHYSVRDRNIRKSIIEEQTLAKLEAKQKK